jgi:hypothetical protein
MNDAHLPPSILAEQQAWERRQRILRAHAAGMSYRAIADRLGITAGRVAQMMRHARREAGRLSPAQRYEQREVFVATRAVYEWLRRPIMPVPDIDLCGPCCAFAEVVGNIYRASQ